MVLEIETETNMVRQNERKINKEIWRYQRKLKLNSLKKIQNRSSKGHFKVR